MNINTVTVLGANGTMGCNISGIFASFGNAKVYMVSRSMEKERLQADSRQGKLGEALDRIHSRLEEDINIEELSRELGMSSRYLRKTFEDSIGISCSQYITMLRIARAKELLWDWEKDITQVASLTGFNSPQYFCRIFKKHTGMTPAQYRNMKKERPELTEET